jgi:hypothetical protein
VFLREKSFTRNLDSDEYTNEKAAVKIAIARGDNMNLETMVAVPVEEARKLTA